MSNPRHAFEEHLGEVQIRVEAEDLGDLFAEAGRALAELESDVDAQGAAQLVENVSIEAPDREALLVDWLNELIFRSETRRCAFNDVLVTFISDRALQARIAGTAVMRPRLPVKAATLHALRIDGKRGAFRATIVLDV